MEHQRLRRLLAAVDFSPVSGRVLDTAAELARSLGAKLWLIHVAAPEPDFVGYGPGPQTVRDQRAEELHEKHRELQEEATRLRSAGLEVTALLVQGPTVEKLLEEIESLEIDLLVVGSHGHGRLYDVLLGSTSDGLLRRSKRPVLVVPSLS